MFDLLTKLLDQTINLHKELTRIMAEFAAGLESDLKHAKIVMVEHTREMHTNFEGALSQAGRLKAKMQDAMDIASNAVQVSIILVFFTL
jgi:hypothetical protein